MGDAAPRWLPAFSFLLSPEGSQRPEVAQFPHTAGVKMSSSWWPRVLRDIPEGGRHVPNGVTLATTAASRSPHAQVSLPSPHTISITQNILPVPLSTSHPSPPNLG